jgi:rhodanese-related sulfurtransferase
MPPLIRQIALLLGLAVFPALAAAFLHPKKPSWQSEEVLLTTVQSWGDRVLWVDARPSHEFAQGHIPDAVPVNEDAWDESLPALLEQWEADRIVVVYCSSLSCAASHDVARRLREEVGLPEVRVLSGGWEAWKAAQR